MTQGFVKNMLKQNKSDEKFDDKYPLYLSRT